MAFTNHYGQGSTGHSVCSKWTCLLPFHSYAILPSIWSSCPRAWAQRSSPGWHFNGNDCFRASKRNSKVPWEKREGARAAWWYLTWAREELTRHGALKLQHRRGRLLAWRYLT